MHGNSLVYQPVMVYFFCLPFTRAFHTDKYRSLWTSHTYMHAHNNYTHAHIHMYTHIHILTHLHAHKLLYTHAPTHIHVHTLTYAHERHTHVHVLHPHKYTHTYTHSMGILPSTLQHQTDMRMLSSCCLGQRLTQTLLIW